MAAAKFTSRDMLMGLGERPGTDVTARLLLALTALYAERMQHTEDEERQYVELALRLIDRVDARTRATVGAMLAGHAAAPVAVCAHLARMAEVGEAAGAAAPIDSAPIDNPPMAVTAPPDSASGAVVAATADAPAAAPAAAPRDAPSPAAAMPTAMPPAAPLPAAVGEAFFAATAAQRRDLLASIAVAPGASATEPAPRHDFSGLDAAALEGRIGEAIRGLERLLAIPRGLTERIFNDVSGEPLVVAAKAVGMPIAVLQRILLLVNPAVSHSVHRVYDLTDFYHDLDRAVAVSLLALWRAAAKPNGPAAAADSGPEAARDLPSMPDSAVTGLRHRFGALTDRLNGRALKPRPAPGSSARRDLQSR